MNAVRTSFRRLSKISWPLLAASIGGTGVAAVAVVAVVMANGGVEAAPGASAAPTTSAAAPADPAPSVGSNSPVAAAPPGASTTDGTAVPVTADSVSTAGRGLVPQVGPPVVAPRVVDAPPVTLTPVGPPVVTPRVVDAPPVTLTPVGPPVVAPPVVDAPPVTLTPVGPPVVTPPVVEVPPAPAPDTTAPDPAQDLWVEFNSSTDAMIGWEVSPSADTDHYLIYQATLTSGQYADAQAGEAFPAGVLIGSSAADFDPETPYLYLDASGPFVAHSFYGFTVVAVDASGNESARAQTTWEYNPMPSLTDLSFDPVTSYISWTWLDPEGSDAQVNISVDGTFYTFGTLTSGTYSTNMASAHLASGTTHVVSFQIIDPNYVRSDSDLASIQITISEAEVVVAPSAPTNLQYDASVDGGTLYWDYSDNSGTDPDEFVISWDGGSRTTTGDARSFNLAPWLRPGVTTTVSLTAYRNGAPMSDAATVTATAPAPVVAAATPTNLRYDPNVDGGTLYWDYSDSSGADPKQFNLHWDNDGGGAVIDASTRSYNVGPHLPVGTTTLSLTAYRSGKGWSAPGTVTATKAAPPAPVTPATPTNLRYDTTEYNGTLYWDYSDSSGADPDWFTLHWDGDNGGLTANGDVRHLTIYPWLPVGTTTVSLTAFRSGMGTSAPATFTIMKTS